MQTIARLWKRLVYLLLEAPFDNVDLAGALNLIGWGAWLELAFPTFTPGGIYATMLQLAPETSWGAGMILLGVLRAITNLRDRNRERMATIAASCFFYLFVFACLVRAKPSASLTYMALFLSVVSMWELFRIVKKFRLRRIAHAQVEEDLYHGNEHV